MGETYLVSLLLAGGTSLGFAVHSGSLALHRAQRGYLYLTLLSLLQAAYCVVTYAYFRQSTPAEALPWGRGICVFTPYITYFFGQLVLRVMDGPRGWLVRFQRANLAVTTAFVMLVVADAMWDERLALTGEVATDLTSLHRHRLEFAPLGVAYLAWVSVAFTLFAVLLLRSYRERRELLPAVGGCIFYFAATIHDFGILSGIHHFYFLQHFGYFALVAGWWRVLTGTYERSVDELNRVIGNLEEQKTLLLSSSALIQEQKLSAMGTLAAGVAHEINNPIHGIQNYAELLRRGVPVESREYGFVREIISECRRVTEIVRALLNFARAGSDELIGAVQVGELIDDALKLTGRSLSDDDIEVACRVEPALPDLSANAQQLQQVIMNLVTNARDALNARGATRKGPKRIDIHAFRRVDQGEDWIVIEVRDTGSGIEPAVLVRIFDPFFTTKSADKGTGLGLSISHGIVASHGGVLRCKSRPGEGSRFIVEIPVPSSAATTDGARPLTHWPTGGGAPLSR